MHIALALRFGRFYLLHVRVGSFAFVSWLYTIRLLSYIIKLIKVLNNNHICLRAFASWWFLIIILKLHLPGVKCIWRHETNSP